MESWILFSRYTCPLVSAIGEKNIAMVRLLLERGANVNTEGGATLVPLIKAVDAGNMDIFGLLLRQPGIDVNASHNVNISYDRYESAGYAGEPYDYQIPITALEKAEKGGGPTSNLAMMAMLLRTNGAW
jgi:ankyrin repeat protein